MVDLTRKLQTSENVLVVVIHGFNFSLCASLLLTGTRSSVPSVLLLIKKQRVHFIGQRNI